MPVVYKLNPDAERVSRRLREGFGWYPTNKDNEDQLKLFETSVSRLKTALKGENKEESITPSNMRKNFSWVYAICKTEADLLFAEVQTNPDLYKDMLPDLEACTTYAHALVFALEACFDTYLRNLMSAKDDHYASSGGGVGGGGNGAHPPHGYHNPPSGASRPPRSRSREYVSRDIYSAGYSPQRNSWEDAPPGGRYRGSMVGGRGGHGMGRGGRRF
jgi:hypothetical protein